VGEGVELQGQVNLKGLVAVAPARPAEQGGDPIDALVEGVDVDVERGRRTA
jgi:hypothetical protein